MDVRRDLDEVAEGLLQPPTDGQCGQDAKGGAHQAGDQRVPRALGDELLDELNLPLEVCRIERTALILKDEDQK